MSYPYDAGQNDPGGYGKFDRGPGGYGPAQPAPNNYLVWAILSTVLCCLPLGIVSIVKSAQVNGLWAQGRSDEARAAAASAKKFAIIAAIVGAVILVAYVIVLIAIGVGTQQSTYR
jgi:hypothetical protein